MNKYKKNMMIQNQDMYHYQHKNYIYKEVQFNIKKIINYKQQKN